MAKLLLALGHLAHGARTAVQFMPPRLSVTMGEEADRAALCGDAVTVMRDARSAVRLAADRVHAQ